MKATLALLLVLLVACSPQVQVVERNNTVVQVEYRDFPCPEKECVYPEPQVCACPSCASKEDDKISAHTIHGCMGPNCWYENMTAASPGYAGGKK